MSAIPLNPKQVFLSKTRALVARTFTQLDDKNSGIVIRELQSTCADLIRAVLELQELQLRSSRVADDNQPLDKAMCELFDGQFHRLTQTAAAPQIVRIEHGLRRMPQGAIFLLSGNVLSRVLVNGDKVTNTEPATSYSINVRLNGVIGDEHIFILF